MKQVPNARRAIKRIQTAVGSSTPLAADDRHVLVTAALVALCRMVKAQGCLVTYAGSGDDGCFVVQEFIDDQGHYLPVEEMHKAKYTPWAPDAMMRSPWHDCLGEWVSLLVRGTFDNEGSHGDVYVDAQTLQLDFVHYDHTNNVSRHRIKNKLATTYEDRYEFIAFEKVRSRYRSYVSGLHLCLLDNYDYIFKR
jgi:hypothetical protein